MPACSRIFERAPSAPTSSRAEIVSPSASCTSIAFAACSKPLTAAAAQIDAKLFRLRDQRIDQMPVLDHVRERLARLDLAAEGEERRPHRVVELVVGDHHVEDRLRVAATASQTPIASNRRRAAAAIAEARGSFDGAAASAGSATVTAKLSPSALAQRDRQRQAGKAGAADHHIGLL